MGKLVKVKINDTEIWMETEDGMEAEEITSKLEPKLVSRGSVESMTEEALDAAKNLHESIRAYCTSLAQGFQSINAEQRPSKITAEFGLKLSGDSKFYVVNVGGEGSLKITAEWEMK